MAEHVLKKEVNSLREEYSKNGVVAIKNVLNSYWLEVLRKAVELQLREKNAILIIVICECNQAALKIFVLIQELAG